MIKVTNLLSISTQHNTSLGSDCWWSWTRRLKDSNWFSKQKLWRFYRLFSTKIFTADVLVSHSWIYSEVQITQAKMNLRSSCVCCSNNIHQGASSQSADGWFMSCWSIIIIFTTNLISQHMTWRCEHKRYSFRPTALYFCS